MRPTLNPGRWQSRAIAALRVIGRARTGNSTVCGAAGVPCPTGGSNPLRPAGIRGGGAYPRLRQAPLIARRHQNETVTERVDAVQPFTRFGHPHDHRLRRHDSGGLGPSVVMATTAKGAPRGLFSYRTQRMAELVRLRTATETRRR